MSVERILKESSIDCYLNKDGNVYPLEQGKILTIQTSSGEKLKYQIGDKPYSRDCDYKKDCNYKCSWEPLPGDKIRINDDTYNMIFARTDINEAKHNIKKLFRKNVVYDLEDIEKEMYDMMPNLEKNFLYKALDEMVSQKEVVYDKYSRDGYLIYKGNYYIYQPKEIKNENIPLYYRDIPILSKTKSLPISAHLIDTNINNKINNENNKNIMRKLEQSIKYFEQVLDDTNVINENKINKNDEYDIILSMVLDRIKNTTMIILLKDIINKKNNNKTLDRIEDDILKYYSDNLFSDNLLSNKSNNNEILGFKFEGKYLCVKNKSWSTCDEDIRKKIEILEKIRNKKKVHKKNNMIMGAIKYDKKGYMFQIIDTTKYKEPITATARKSKRAEIKGRVCDTFNFDQLKIIQKILRINSELKDIKKQLLCIILEFFFRYHDLKDNNILWWKKDGTMYH